jgi:putative transposase
MADNMELTKNDPGWLDLSKVGKLEGVKRRAISWRLQQDKYPADKIRQWEGNGGRQWQIHYTALSIEAQAKYLAEKSTASLDSKLADVIALQTKAPAPPTMAAFMSAGERERKKAARKQQIVERFRSLSSLIEKEALAKEAGVPLSTLYQWNQRYDGTAASLLRGRGRPAGATSHPSDQVEFATQLYLQKEKPSPAAVWAALRASYGEQAPSRATIYRWLSDDKRVNPALACYIREGKQKFRDKHEKVRRRDWSLIPVNHTWVGDHHEFDLLVITPEGKIARQWLTAWEDAHSRAIVGYTCNFQPCAMEIALALQNGILPKEGLPYCGTPSWLYVDNGKDYRSKHLNGDTVPVFRQEETDPVWGLFGHLGIKTRFCEPYHGKSKPIERLFGTLERLWIWRLPGYCGRNPQHRPAHLEEDVAKTQEWLASNGQRGERRLLLWWEAEAEFAAIMDAYNHHPHAAHRFRCPADIYAEERPLPQIPAKEALAVLILPSTLRQVRNQGISLAIKRESRRYWAPALSPMIGQTVEVRYNPNDPSRILVMKDRQVICWAAHEPDAAPFVETEEERSELADFLAGNARLRKEYAQKREAMRLSSPMDMMTPYPAAPTTKPALALMPARRLTGYEKAGAQAAKAASKPPTSEQLKAVNDLFLFKCDRNRALRQKEER